MSGWSMVWKSRTNGQIILVCYLIHLGVLYEPEIGVIVYEYGRHEVLKFTRNLLGFDVFRCGCKVAHLR